MSDGIEQWKLASKEELYEETKMLRRSIAERHDGIKKLREFAEYVMAEVWDHNEDFGSIQDKAESLGLLELRPIPEEDSIDGETEHYFLTWTSK